MKIISRLWLITLLVPMAANADICDDINDVANGWNDVANLVEEYGSDQPLTRAEERQLTDLVVALREGSEALVYLLRTQGDDYEVRLGADLADSLDDVYGARHDITLVDSIDDVVDTMDAVVDYCDEY